MRETYREISQDDLKVEGEYLLEAVNAAEKTREQEASEPQSILLRAMAMAALRTAPRV